MFVGQVNTTAKRFKRVLGRKIAVKVDDAHGRLPVRQGLQIGKERTVRMVSNLCLRV